MTGARVAWDVRGLQPALRTLAAVALAGRDLAPPLREAGKMLADHTRLRFVDGRAPDGTPWKPSQRALREGGKTLRHSGHLMASITHRLVGLDGVEVGTTRVYAAIHQFGGKTTAHVIRPKRKKALAWPGGRHPVKSVNHPGSRIPARPFIGISADDRDDLNEIFFRHLRGAIGGRR